MAMTISEAQQHVLQRASTVASFPQSSGPLASVSLAAEMEHFNTGHLWSFALTETTLTLATTTLTTDLTSTTATTLTVHSSAGFVAGQTLLLGNEQMTLSSISGASDPYTFTVIRGILGTAASTALGGTTLCVRDYPFPSTPGDFNAPYDALLVQQGGILTNLDQRRVDRAIWDQTTPGYPTIYTIYTPTAFLASVSYKQSVRISPPPQSADSVLLKYYRRLNPAGDAVGNVDMLDGLLYAYLDGAVARYLEGLSLSGDGDIAKMRTARSRAAQSWMDAVAYDRVNEEDVRRRFTSRFERGELGPNTGTGGWPLPF